MRINSRLERLERRRKPVESTGIQVRYYTVDYETGMRIYSPPDEGDLFLEEWARLLVERGRQVTP